MIRSNALGWSIALSLCASGLAQVQVQVRQYKPEGGSQTVYEYSVSNVAAPGKIHLSLAVDKAYATPLPTSDLQLVTAGAPPWCQAPCYSADVKPDSAKTGQKPLKLLLSAPTAETAAATGAYAASETDTGNTTVPKAAFDEGLFTVVIGTGTLVTSRGATNYEVLQATNTLRATSIGRNNVDLTVGGAFNLGIPMRTWSRDVATPLNAFVSLKFTPGSDNAINGFVFGIGYQLTKYLEVVGGVGLTPRQVPSIGLRRVAFNAVLANPGYYQSFVAQDLLLNRGQGVFDGFPLVGPDNKPLYPGEPLVNHYRTGAFVGIAFPIKLKAALAGR